MTWDYAGKIPPQADIFEVAIVDVILGWNIVEGRFGWKNLSLTLGKCVVAGIFEAIADAGTFGANVDAGIFGANVDTGIFGVNVDAGTFGVNVDTGMF